ncbi:MAG: universal stress protein [Gudongella sp.]|jgi:nucleotide-binding universal stress UspA family protein|nr:universal stress protein [Gudongella sp.]
MNKILVAADGSKYSKKALFKARQLATSLNCEVAVLTVVNIWDNVYVQNRELKLELGKTALNHAEKVLREAEEIFEGFEGDFSTLHKTGDIVEEIVRFAEEENFDLLIMGSRGLGAFSRTLLGSVSDKVIHHIGISVMIVK